MKPGRLLIGILVLLASGALAFLAYDQGWLSFAGLGPARAFAEQAGETVTLSVGQEAVVRGWSPEPPGGEPLAGWTVAWDEDLLRLSNFGTDWESRPGLVGEWWSFQALGPGTAKVTLTRGQAVAEYTFIFK